MSKKNKKKSKNKNKSSKKKNIQHNATNNIQINSKNSDVKDVNTNSNDNCTNHTNKTIETKIAEETCNKQKCDTQKDKQEKESVITKQEKEDTITTIDNNKESNSNSDKCFLRKHKNLIISTIAVISTAALSTLICHNHYTNKLSEIYKESIAPLDDLDTSGKLSKFRDNISKKNLINPDLVYNVDLEYDYKFERFKDTVIDSFVITSSSIDNPQEIFVIESSDPTLVYSELEKYKETLLESKNKNNSKILEQIKFDEAGKYVYLIASENASKIEKILLDEINQ